MLYYNGKKIADFTSLDKSNIKNIIDNISFNVDVQLKELSTLANNKESGFANEIIASAIKGGIIGETVGVVSLIITIVGKRKDS